MLREPRGASRHAALRVPLCTLLALSSLPGCAGKSQVSEPTAAPFAVHGDTTLIFGSGSRLKAHYLNAGGGARKRLAFHDTLLNTECNFVQTSLAQYHCLPVSFTYSYADSACTVATVPVATSCPDAPTPAMGDLIGANADDCSALAGAYSLDTQQDLTSDFAAPIYATSSCSHLPDKPTAEAVWTTKPEPLARFVAGTPSIVGSPGGMQAKRVTGDDGSFDTLEPSVAGERCTRATIDGVNRCVPGPYGERTFDLYADATCTDPNVAQTVVTFTQQCTGELTQYILDGKGNGCGSNTTVYALGEPLSTVYTLNEQCAAVVPRAGELAPYYRVGARVAGVMFPIVHLAQVGAGAVTVSCIADEAGTPILTRNDARFGIWALANGLSCLVFEDPSGQKRCIHDTLPLGTVSYFADASCTAPIYAADLSCGEPPIAYLVEQAFGFCSPKFNHLYLANPYSGPLYSTESGLCKPYAPPSSFLHFYTTGQNIDPQIFPALSDTTDP